MTNRIEEKIVQQIEEGNIKEASQRLTLDAGGTESFLIKTPEEAEEKVSVLAFTISNEATLALDVYEDVSINTNGTEMNITNSKTASQSTTNLVLEYGGDYTTGTKASEDIFPAGTKNSSTGARTNDIRRIVSKGDALRYDFTNQDTSNSKDIALKIIFFEKPVE